MLLTRGSPQTSRAQIGVAKHTVVNNDGRSSACSSGVAPHLSLCAALISFMASFTFAAGSISVTSTWGG